ncbi:hypothetical protein Q8A73_001299 [Channa argus]|nr:hypothetical protein Q8A73_001299 [Channa argus]
MSLARPLVVQSALISLALLVCHQTCPDSSCPPGRLGPPPTLCPMLPRYAPDASQLVCRLCGAGRLLETDARATVGPCLSICVIGQPWALTVTFTAGRDSERVQSQQMALQHQGTVEVKKRLGMHSGPARAGECSLTLHVFDKGQMNPGAIGGAP